MKAINFLIFFFLLGIVSSYGQQNAEKERIRIKKFSDNFFYTFIKNNNGIIRRSEFAEGLQIPNTYVIQIQVPKENTIDDIKKIVSEFNKTNPAWIIKFKWAFDDDRYSCVYYNTGYDIAITYGFLPSHPTQLMMLVNSYSSVVRLTN